MVVHSAGCCYPGPGFPCQHTLELTASATAVPGLRLSSGLGGHCVHVVLLYTCRPKTSKTTKTYMHKVKIKRINWRAVMEDK